MGDRVKIAIIFIGTSKYANFFEGYKKAVDSYFLTKHEKKFFVFTDQEDLEFFSDDNVTTTKIDHVGWPWITLHRFKFMTLVKEELLKHDYIFFLDADLWPCAEINDDILNHEKPLIGVQHPGFLGKIGTFETNTDSTANIFDDFYDLSTYRQGCFWGGKSPDIVKMITELDARVDEDTKNDIVAVWHDESHMNKYFLENNDSVYTLHPGYATPQQGYDNIKAQYKTMMVHLHKDLSEFPRFARSK